MATLPSPSLIPSPSRPFDTARLSLRAVRLPIDEALFTALNNDHLGYMNSSAPNITLPGPTQATKYCEHVAKECLVGAVIWLRDTPNDDASTNPAKQIPDDAIRSEWGTAIGEIHLSLPSTPAMAHHRSTSIGLTILPGYQGRGYGREAIEWALDYAFRRAGLHRVEIRAFGWNEGATRLYERMGFVREGTERKAYWHEGRWWDGVSLGMLEDEWWARRRAKSAREGEEEGRRASRAIRIEDEGSKEPLW
ncbi:hypothetical protein E8E13_000483 [Curvularia kusanoi]|uniref:N-acetyltransferase domain-containing protein n=1 Tax=Curvularia kusanoi TaxID=90978 RepID=A0A9P4T4F2_CURKU|nr:hypothetical protein E8E13_000483 [Curvularia kusanoi]